MLTGGIWWQAGNHYTYNPTGGDDTERFDRYDATGFLPGTEGINERC